MEARVRISSPQIRGEVEVKVSGKAKLILVNGHWNSLAHKLGMSPGAPKEAYWSYFLGSDFPGFIRSAWDYFENNNYDEKPYYADGSSQWGGDLSGSGRKQKGYRYGIEHLAEIVKGVGNEPIYLISHSEGCAYAAGIAKALIEKGYKVGESIMLSADEGDEFSVEDSYPSYQIVGGRIARVEIVPASLMNQPKSLRLGLLTLPNKHRAQLRLGKSNFRVKRNRLYLDPVVSDYRVKGVTRYGIYIYQNASITNIHAMTIEERVFRALRELKTLQVVSVQIKGHTKHYIKGMTKHNWHKVDYTFIENNQVDIYTNHGKTIYRR